MNMVKVGETLEGVHIMLVNRYSSGDGWNTPYVSGYDVLYERIIDDMEKSPHLYQDWEKALLEKDSRFLSCEDEKRLQEYIEDWIYAKCDVGYC